VRWDALPAAPRRIAVAQAVVKAAARNGFSRRAMAAASTASLGTADAWRELFPGGATEALWFVSAVSDASMRSALVERPPADMAAVIDERFEQNSHLKTFVRRVMLYDLLHPWQAVARMQRTARVMVECLPPNRRRVGRARLTLLNLLYTMLVFHWLFDGTDGDARTRRMTRSAMRRLSL
jgi:hypothetical protein